ncbi:hamartin isoform X2 [Melanaphis sacchari]|uniref:hamartin isoform X1 n=1 Tax=Melanaphis sacchari TaxID=742174 RepID=UPI000DC1481C|nr:hamartin isoform X1 [Melanaphis sacchari]XP_025197523.1 hamartin isoform X1 [Melanaphis sacchari]XP_025197524.1 hamartin isoform X2 [Melanaphis sacchari]
MIAMEVMELFTSLESNIPQEVEVVKHKFHDQFNIVKEPWLLNGMYDYFISTGSQRAIEVLVAVREPHDKYLFDRLVDGIRGTNRLQALTLLGHVVKRQPTWLIKIINHDLLKELIKLLKSENEIIIITSALLALNVLLTVIPALISSSLPDIFEGFSRLAAWNTSQKNKVSEIHLFHLQISLYVLFVQLYSMYPCSFVIYLNKQYSKPDNHLVFTHTIKPMVETMRMHPSLIVSSKDVETSVHRWKKMEQHDVVMECTRYTLLENGDRNYQNPSTWTNAGSNFSSALEVLKSSIGATGDIVSVNSIRDKEVWSPMLYCGEFHKDTVKSMPTTPNIQNFYKPLIFNHNEHSPPEAAVEATPETTPIRDDIYQQSRLPSINSTVVRALNSFGIDNLSRRSSSTPNSQPNSPLKKEGFVFPSEDIQSQFLVRKVDRMIMERNQITDSIKDEPNVRSESKPIAAQTQLTNNPEIIQTGDEEECDQQSNGSPCQTHEGGLHMPDSASLKEFVMSVRTRKRYYSQCTPEKTINVTGQSTDSSPKKGPEFSQLSVRRAYSCPEIKKTNGSSISSGNSPLQEETEENHYRSGINISNGHVTSLPKKKSKNDTNITKVQTVSTQTEHILPYEHLFYNIFPAYNNDPHNSTNNQEDESLNLIEKYVRTSAIVLNHRHTAQSSNDVKLLQDQIALLTLQLQFERSRREVHAERNRRLLGKSRSSRAIDEHNSALKDQVLTLQVEIEDKTSGFEKSRQDSLKQIKDLKERVFHWQTECLKYQEETKEAKNKCLSLEQLYNGESLKTAEVTKQLSETKAELFNTLSELNIVQATANISKELKSTVINLQRELVMSGEMQSQQRDVVSHINALRYDASNAMLSQESYKHNIKELQNMLDHKSALLEASNARIADLELKLSNKNACIQNDKHKIELVKKQFNKQLSEMKEECRILKEIQCKYREDKEEEESKKKFIEELPKFSSDLVMVDSNTSVSDQDANFRLSMMLADIDNSRGEISVIPTTPK